MWIEFIYIFLGIFSFFISGIDDIAILILFFKHYSPLAIISGTVFALILVITISFFIWIELKWNIFINILLPLFLAIWWLLKIFGKEYNLNIFLKKAKYPFFLSFFTYLLNAGDDFTVYSIFFLKFSAYESIYFIIGIFLWIIISIIFANHIRKKIKKITNYNIEKIIGIIMILLAMSIFLGNHFSFSKILF